MGIKHHFQSARADNTDAGEVQPSHWNADHDLTGVLAELDALGVGANLLIYFNGSSQIVTAAFSSLAQNFLAQTTTATMRTAIGAAPLDSPGFTGVPTAPTAAQGTNTTQIATMAAVQNEIAHLVGGAPTALDTLKELADAINDDASFAATVTAALGNRLRVDAAQTLTAGQKSQALANLGVGTGSIEVVIDGGGSVLTTGLKGYLIAPVGGTLTEATLLGDRSGSVVVDIYKCTYAQFDAGATHPVSGDKITASAPPTITSATKSDDATLAGWITAFSAGDIFAFNINSATNIQRVALSLKYTK